MPATVLLAHRSITALQLVHPRLCQRPRCCPALQTTSWQLPARPAAQGAAGVRVWASAAAATGGTPFEPSKPRVQQESRLPALLTPLSDPTANAKLLALCFAQMLSSVSTLLHDTYLPLYMSEVLHMSNTKMGALHALLQFVARASGVISGRLADILSPARMVILGTLLTALCKPMFAVVGWVEALLGTAACVSWITFAKVFDRTMKGVREAPSKALVGDLAADSGDSPAGAFSIRQALSTLGMLVGSMAASLAFRWLGGSYVMTFALSTVPAALALLLVVTAFGGGRGKAAEDAHKQAHIEALTSVDEAWEKRGLAAKAEALLTALPPAYWQALAVTWILYTARFDVAWISLHASTVMDKANLPLLTPLSMAPVVLLATPMGMLAKRSAKARNIMLLLGIAVLIAGDLAYAFMPSLLGMVLGSLCVGVHMAMTQGVSFGMLSSYIPSGTVPGLGRISGTVWSLTDLLLGVALACSNTVAGYLCDKTVKWGMGNTGCFLGGAVSCAASMLALMLFSAFGDLGRDDLLKKGPAAA